MSAGSAATQSSIRPWTRSHSFSFCGNSSSPIRIVGAWLPS